MICTIHQPNFMPWYPFFQKMAAADIFVVLAECQFEKNGYQNRFNIDSDWYTMRINKGMDPIKEKRYVNAGKDWRAIKAKLPQYARVLDHMDYAIGNNLLETNFLLIAQIKHLLGIKTRLRFDFNTSSRGTERLVELCQHYGCNTYLSGLSGREYLDEQLFADEGIIVRYQDESCMERKPIVEVLNGIL